MKLYKGPWVWDEKCDIPAWVAPSGSVGSIDLRALPAQAKRKVAEGHGLFMTDANLGSEYSLLTEKRSEMASVCYDYLMNEFDPSGETAHKPLMPSKGKIKISIGDQEIVEDMKQFGSHWEGFKDVRKLDLLKNFNSNKTISQKFLGTLENEYGDFNQFLHADISDLKPIKPETTITESFNKSDSATLGPDQTWTEQSAVGDLGSSLLSVAGNQFREDPGNDRNSSARCDAALSSDNHYAQVTLTSWPAVVGRMATGIIVRYHSSNADFYLIQATKSLAGNNVYRLFKFITGSASVLSTPSQAFNQDDVIKLINQGSDLNAYINGSLSYTITDTAITGNLRCGIQSTNTNALDDARGDNFVASDDLGGGGSVFISNTMLMGVG